jgi:hypothetical protein
MIEESHDSTNSGVGIACDAELHQHRESVEVGAFAEEIGAIELEDRY